jgi:hypothetical protein
VDKKLGFLLFHFLRSVLGCLSEEELCGEHISALFPNSRVFWGRVLVVEGQLKILSVVCVEKCCDVVGLMVLYSRFQD